MADTTFEGSVAATGGFVQRVVRFGADGEIALGGGLAVLTKETAGAYTLAAPKHADDGRELIITAGTAAAHVVTTDPGFNGSATTNTATFGGSKGATLRLLALGGEWLVMSAESVTLDDGEA